MRNAFSIEGRIGPGMEKPLFFDKRDIDNADPYAPSRLKYLDRINTVIRLVENRFPVPPDVRVAELGCAQANISLLLAEKGYDVTAMDINPSFLEYAKLKREKGRITWIDADFSRYDFQGGRFDAVILGEVIEHCAFPEDIIAKVSDLIKPGGMLILTTPNGKNPSFRLPVFENIWEREKRKDLVSRQFGPEAGDHLFLFTAASLPDIMTNDLMVEKIGYCGGTPLYNRIYKFFKILPVAAAQAFLRLLSCLPLVRTFTFSNLYLAARKL